MGSEIKYSVSAQYYRLGRNQVQIHSGPISNSQYTEAGFFIPARSDKAPILYVIPRVTKKLTRYLEANARRSFTSSRFAISNSDGIPRTGNNVAHSLKTKSGT